MFNTVIGAGHGHAFLVVFMDVTRSEYKHVFAHHTPFTFGFHVSHYGATGSTLKQKDKNEREDHVKEVEVGVRNTWRAIASNLIYKSFLVFYGYNFFFLINSSLFYNPVSMCNFLLEFNKYVIEWEKNYLYGELKCESKKYVQKDKKIK